MAKEGGKNPPVQKLPLPEDASTQCPTAPGPGRARLGPLSYRKLKAPLREHMLEQPLHQGGQGLQEAQHPSACSPLLLPCPPAVQGTSHAALLSSCQAELCGSLGGGQLVPGLSLTSTRAAGPRPDLGNVVLHVGAGRAAQRYRCHPGGIQLAEAEGRGEMHPID